MGKKIIVTSGGVGTTIAEVIKATKLDIFVKGVDCGCKDREKKINELLPYRFKARCLTEEEYKQWNDFKERSIPFNKETVTWICELYASVFNRLIWLPQPQESQKPLYKMIDLIDKVFEQY
jgi:hypothetical protein